MKKLSSEQELMVATVRQFVDKEVVPVASAMEHRNEYPHALVEQMRAMGLFGLNVPEEFGGAEIDFTTFAMIFEELSRGWLGLAGIIGTHSVLCDVLIRFGTRSRSGSSCLDWRRVNGAAEFVCRNRARVRICRTLAPRRYVMEISTALTDRKCG
jgi:alkylation response protein AidB-like acyl-CoA dehydrogenase